MTQVAAGDDAAVLADGTAVTMDTLVQGVHFDDCLSPEDVGWKAVAVSVSDLASTGAQPEWMVLSLALPSYDPRFVSKFSRGLATAAKRWSIQLIGGDTTRTMGPLVVSITMGGGCVASPVLRSGAQQGDRIWVTGVPGLAALGRIARAPPATALRALRRPEPPLDFALALAQAPLVTAMMDLSDGLASDLPRMCSASELGARIREASLPSCVDLTTHADFPSLQLGGGDDYELLFTAPSSNDVAIRSLALQHGVRVSHIGSMTKARSLSIDNAGWPAPCFTHFGASP